MIYTFSANTNTYRSKPTKKQAAAISNNMDKVTIDSVEGFIEDIEQGIS